MAARSYFQSALCLVVLTAEFFSAQVARAQTSPSSATAPPAAATAPTPPAPASSFTPTANPATPAPEPAHAPDPPPAVELPPPPPPTNALPAETIYQFGKKEEVKAPLWQAAVAMSFSATTGNANVISLNGSANVARNDGVNRVALTLDGNYAITKTRALADMNGNGVADKPDEVGETSQTSAGYFIAKLRYDRFFTKNNTGYLTLASGLDRPASQQVFLSGQVGYMRQLVKTQMHLLSGEVGYDFTYTRLIAPRYAAARLC